MEETNVEIIPARKKAKKVIVGIYARVGTARKAQLKSLAAQISGLTGYCYRFKYPLKDIYIDVASGKKDTERPGFTRLIRDCERGAINLVMMNRCCSEESISDCQHSSGRTKLAAWEKNF